MRRRTKDRTSDLLKMLGSGQRGTRRRARLGGEEAVARLQAVRGVERRRPVLERGETAGRTGETGGRAAAGGGWHSRIARSRTGLSPQRGRRTCHGFSAVLGGQCKLQYSTLGVGRITSIHASIILDTEHELEGSLVRCRRKAS
ncbi:hypothetical protein BS78_05G138400 [Paspalum vaginatum]|nr:hypothetical protein BS78_05G138400 [Paspalum vaginatum]